MNRADAEHDIEQLYGLTGGWLEQAVEHFGTAALTDEAIVWIAQQQRYEDQAQADRVNRPPGS